MIIEMSDLNREKILAGVAVEDFVGREADAEMLARHAEGASGTQGLLLISAPLTGASELLRQTYDRLFTEQSETIPVYFALRRSDRTARQAATRFVQTFLQQAIAFRRRDAKIIDAAPDVCELAELAAPRDAHWIDRLVTGCQTAKRLDQDDFFVRGCLSAPLRADAEGAPVFVIIDNLHNADYLAGDADFFGELKEVYARSAARFVFAGHRRFLFGAAKTAGAKLENTNVAELKPLNFAAAGLLAEKTAARCKVILNEQTRDLIAAQTDGNPAFIKNLMETARDKKSSLESFQHVEQIYTDEILGGATAKYYDAIFEQISLAVEVQKQILGLLYAKLSAGTSEKTPIDAWRTLIGLSEPDFYGAMRLLNVREIVRVASNSVETMPENQVLTDYIKGRFQLETIGETRSRVVVATLSEFLKRAPQTMARFYRRSSALGLREMLTVFNCQEIPDGLIDYSVFKSRLKGAPAAEILKYFAGKTEKIILPQISYAAHTATFYPSLNQVVEAEQSAVGTGFARKSYTDADEIVWLAAEVESKAEATREATEFWCDRLEMVALVCNFSRYKVWLVAPEGFAPDALEVLKQRSAYGSSRKQFQLLAKFLKAGDVLSKAVKANEYEMIVPVGEDTELIAAHAVEEIARRHSFAPKAINQIKTALVEACINTGENSNSPDRKIYQRFSVEADKIIITVSDRGIRLTDKNAVEMPYENGRRGWGLKLMKTLMDEVKFERVDDGTRISMVKYMNK